MLLKLDEQINTAISNSKGKLFVHPVVASFWFFKTFRAEYIGNIGRKLLLHNVLEAHCVLPESSHHMG